MVSWEKYLQVSGWTSEYESVNNFLRHYARKARSSKTRENICLTLKGFCEFAEKNPDELIKLSSRGASKLLQDYVDMLAEKGFSIRYVNVCLAYLKTFFKVNGFKGENELEVERHHQPSRYRKRSEYVPTSDEIHAMALAAETPRNRALILCLYTSGLRNSTLRALLYRDVKEEIERGAEIVKLPVYPEMKKIDAGACKGNIPYYSFISKEAVEALREYLNERKRIFGSINDEEPLFISESKYLPLEVRRKTPVMKKSLEALIKRAARKAGIKRWCDVYPHCLRKAFESALRNNGLDVKDQEFLMGHILPGSQDAYYDYSKVEDLKAKYARIRFFRTAEIDKLEMIKAFAKTLGIENIEIKIQKVKEKEPNITDEEAVGRIIKEELGIKPLEMKPARYKENEHDCNANNCKYQSLLVTEDKLLPYLNEGWDIVKELRNGKIVIRKKF